MLFRGGDDVVAGGDVVVRDGIGGGAGGVRGRVEERMGERLRRESWVLGRG